MSVWVAGLVAFGIAFPAGWLVCRAWLAAAAGDRGAGSMAPAEAEDSERVPKAHMNALLRAQRSRYRRRVQLIHDVVRRHERTRDQIREKLDALQRQMQADADAAQRQAERLAARESELDASRARIAALERNAESSPGANDPVLAAELAEAREALDEARCRMAALVAGAAAADAARAAAEDRARTLEASMTATAQRARALEAGAADAEARALAAQRAGSDAGARLEALDAEQQRLADELAQAHRELAASHARIAELDQAAVAAAADRAALDAARSRLDELERTSAVAATERAALETTAARLAEELAETRARAAREPLPDAAVDPELGLLRIERDELSARVRRLEVDPRPDPRPVDAAEPARLRASLGEAREALAHREHRQRELERQLADRDREIDELCTQLRSWKHRVAPLARQIQVQRELLRRQQAGSAAPPAADDLKRIRGIGPGLERRLHANGILRFDQLAALGDDEMAELAGRLGVAGTLPVRDRWAEQAAALAAAPTETA